MQPSLNWQVKLFHFAFEIFFLLLPLFILYIINVFIKAVISVLLLASGKPLQ